MSLSQNTDKKQLGPFGRARSSYTQPGRTRPVVGPHEWSKLASASLSDTFSRATPTQLSPGGLNYVLR